MIDQVPKVSCVITDGVMGFGREAAKQLGIPEVQFWTASAFGFMAYLSYLHYSELANRGINFPFKGIYLVISVPFLSAFIELSIRLINIASKLRSFIFMKMNMQRIWLEIEHQV